MLNLSIIIVTYNSEKEIESCLNSVFENIDDKTEVVVVDNCSSDGTVQLLEEKYPLVRLIRNDKNTGFARSCNQAVKVAKGEYVLFLNPDTVVSNGAFKKMIDFMEANSKMAILGCRILNKDGSVQPSCGNFPSVINIICGL